MANKLPSAHPEETFKAIAPTASSAPKYEEANLPEHPKENAKVPESIPPTSNEPKSIQEDAKIKSSESKNEKCEDQKIEKKQI